MANETYRQFWITAVRILTGEDHTDAARSARNLSPLSLTQARQLAEEVTSC